MPENSNTSGLLDRIREQLALMAKPGPIPLHPQVKEALRIIAEFLQGVEDGNTEENQQNELQDKAIQELKDLISGINAALVTIKADDEATKTTILGIQTELEGIKTRLDNADTDLVGKINAALEPLLSALETLRGQDLAHTGRMNELESGLNALLQKIGNLPDESTLAELLSILQDNLSGLQTSITALQGKDTAHDQSITDMLVLIAALETRLDNTPIGEGLTVEQVRTLVGTMLSGLISDITALKDQDTTDNQRIQGILDDIGLLKTRLDNTPIGEGLTEEQVKTLVDNMLEGLITDIGALKGQDETDNQRIQGILGDIEQLNTRLGNLVVGDGLTREQVKTLVDTMLLGLMADITTLQAQDLTDNQRIQGIIDDFVQLKTRLDNLVVGDGLTMDQVKVMVEGMLQSIQTDLTNLKEQGITTSTNLNELGGRVTALEEKDKTDLKESDVDRIVEGKLQPLHTTITGLTNQGQLNAIRFTNIETEIGSIRAILNSTGTGGGTLNGISLQQMVDYVQGVLQPILTDLATLRSFKESTIATLGTLTSDVAGLKNALTQNPPQKWLDEAVQKSLAAAVAELKPLITALQGTTDGHTTLIEGLRTDLTALQGTVACLPPILSEAQVLGLIDGKLDTFQEGLDERFTTIDTSWETRINVLIGQITGFQTTLGELPTAEEIKTQVLESLDEWKQGVDSDIEDLKQGKGLLEQRDIQLQTAIDSANARIDEQAQNLGKDIQEQAKAVGLLQNWQAEVKGKLPGLEKCCTEGKEQLHDLAEEIEQIKHDFSHASGLPLALGSGIVTGLEIRRDSNQNVIVYPGYGWTTQGIRLELLEKQTFYFYKELDPDEDEAVFAYFKGLSNSKQRHIWEISPDDCNRDPAYHTLHPRRPEQQRQTPFLDDKVVVMFSGDECTRFFLLQRRDIAGMIFPKSLDYQRIRQKNDGQKEFNLWEKSAQSSSDHDPTLELSDYELYNELNPVMDVPLLSLRRFGYGSLDIATMPCDERYHPVFCKEYNPKNSAYVFNTFAQVAEEYRKIIGPAIDELEHAVKKHLHQFGYDWFGEHAAEYLEKHINNLCKRWKQYTKLPVLAGEYKIKKDLADQTGIQYWYGFVRDLTDAFNELREATLAFHALLPESNYPYPYHLLLGTPREELSFSYPNPFRSTYRNSPIQNGQVAQLEQLRFLHWRIAIMIKSFFVPELEWDDTASDSYLSVFEDINADNPRHLTGIINMPIRLTPSRSLDQPLGHRAIPFYYDLARHPQSLHWYWDYMATRHNRADFHLSYHSENDAAFVKAARGEVYAGIDKNSYTQQGAAIHPFVFDMKQYPFIRVEGLVGKLLVKSDASYYYKDVNASGAVIYSPIQAFLDQFSKRYNTCFSVEIIELNSNTFPLCGHCLEHLGGVYAGGELVLLVEEVQTVDGKETHKIVADFTRLGACDCHSAPLTDNLSLKPGEKPDPKQVEKEKRDPNPVEKEKPDPNPVVAGKPPRKRPKAPEKGGRVEKEKK